MTIRHRIRVSRIDLPEADFALINGRSWTDPHDGVTIHSYSTEIEAIVCRACGALVVKPDLHFPCLKDGRCDGGVCK